MSFQFFEMHMTCMRVIFKVLCFFSLTMRSDAIRGIQSETMKSIVA